MKQYKLILLHTLLLLTMTQTVMALDRSDAVVMCCQDSVKIKFRQSEWTLDRSYAGNGAALDSMATRLSALVGDSVYRLRHVDVVGAASPEGSVAVNESISEKRADMLFGWLDNYGWLSGSDKTFSYIGRDWEGVLRLAELDPALPCREETLALLRSIVADKLMARGVEPKGSLEKMKRLRGGAPYRYLYRNIFPQVRASKVIISYDRIFAPAISAHGSNTLAMLPDTFRIEMTDAEMVTQNNDNARSNGKSFRLDLRTNLLYDALAVPNLGVRVHIDKRWSVGANWMCAWWSKHSTRKYWRIYGGDIALNCRLSSPPPHFNLQLYRTLHRLIRPVALV